MASAEHILVEAEKRLEARRLAEGIPTTLHTKASGKDTGKTTGKSPETTGKDAPRDRENSREESEGRPNGATASWWVQGLDREDQPESSDSWPLEEYVLEAIRRNQTAWDNAFDNPDKTSGDRGAYLSPCLLFGALLKDRPEFRDLASHDAILKLDPILEALAVEPGSDGWDLLPYQDIHENEIDPRDSLWDVWDRILEPAKLSGPSLSRARALATAYPLDSTLHSHRRDASYKLVVSLAYWLARLHDGETFFLSCRDAGEFAGCSHVQANGLLKRAVGENLLQVKKKGRHGAGAGKASEFTFRLSEIGFL